MKNSILSLIKRKAEFIEPMECTPVGKLLDAPGWFYEIKLDGYRAIAVKSGRKRSKACGSCATSSGRNFNATSRPSSVSSAL
jgi:hypothetical protein